jgi:hypothetical protein
VLSVPCWHLEELPGGGVLWLTRPTPADFDTEEARQVQARALVHLRPELKQEEVLAGLRERSRVFQPVEARFHPDMAPLLQLLVEQVEVMGMEERHKRVERFNAWVPPEAKEWLPEEEAPPTDVEDVEAEVERYKAFHAERLIALLHKEVPAVVKESPEALPAVDDYARGHYWYIMKEKDKEELCIPLLGSYLGMRMVRHLGGRWVPRRKLEETQVVVGGRAWLPFLRARHLVSGEEAWMEYSLTQLYQVAARLAGKPPLSASR